MESTGDLKERFNSSIVQDKEREKMVNSIMHPCREIIVEEMKKDKDFQTLFQEIHFSGSYFDKLAVGNQYDFDLNMIFSIPEEAFEVVEASTGVNDVNFMKFKVVDRDNPRLSW